LSHVLNRAIKEEGFRIRIPLNSGYLFDIEIKRFRTNTLKEATFNFNMAFRVAHAHTFYTVQLADNTKKNFCGKNLPRDFWKLKGWL